MAGAMEAMDSLDTRQSKQRACIKWLLSKAFNNRVPDNLHEPFYRDHEDQEHLKPPIVGGLANAELYCLALANMYSDPNYHSLNHWNILQTLARKGVPVPDPAEVALTETVLIQTNPIRTSAHMAVIEALMVLYAREVVTPERVSAAAQRFGGAAAQAPASSPAAVHEDGLLTWINAACQALNRADGEESLQAPVPTVSSLQELCDGTALAALISFYCPDALPRTAVRVGRVSSLQDCLHNLMLVQEFCQRFLPHNVFHMMPEDVTYMRGSMRQNLIAMLADLFNMLEVHPVKCVKHPGTASGRGSNEHGVRHKRCLPPPPPHAIPDLRSDCDAHSAAPFTVPRSPSATVMGRGRGAAAAAAAHSACSTPERRGASPHRAAAPAVPAAPTAAALSRHDQAEEFVVHRGKGITTLSSMARQNDDRAGPPQEGGGVAAGRPSNWEDARGGATYAGRRSRRSSVSDDSQLTVENFGGSQDRLNFCGRNPEKELATVNSMRKISAPAGPIEPAVPVRSLMQDIRGSLQFMYQDYPSAEESHRSPHKPLERQNSQPQRPDQPYSPIRRQLSSDTITLKQNYSNKGGGDGFYLNNNSKDITDGDINNKLSSFADMRLRSNGDQSGVQVMYSGASETDEAPVTRKKTTTFSTPPPTTTTWQQQSLQHDHHPNGGGGEDGGGGGEDGGGGAMVAQLNNIRLKLEEKRRRIEQDKRRMELSMNRQRQHVGQQAFLQAVTRSKGGRAPADEVASAPVTDDKPCTPQEISSEVAGAESRWLEGDGARSGSDTRRTPDLDGMGLEEYQESIAKMDSSLHDIQTDIARLTSQQSQLQNKQLFQQQPPQQIHQTPQPPQQIHYTPPPQQSQHHQQHHQHQQQQQIQHHHQQQQQNHQQQQQQNHQHLQHQLHQQQQQQQQQYPPPQHHQPSYPQHPPQANIPQLHNQYSSQHNVSSGPRAPALHNPSFGSTPHIPHDYHRQPEPYRDAGYQQNYHDGYEQSPRQFYLHDGGGGGGAGTTPPRRTWAQPAHRTPDSEPRGWQLNQQPPMHQQVHQHQQQSHMHQQEAHQYQQPFHDPHRSWKSPSPQPPVQDARWSPQSFVLHERSSQQAFPVHYNNADRYQNGTDSHQPQNHLSYTVINPSPVHRQSPPPLSSPQRRAKTPQRQGSMPENIRRSESVSLQQLGASPPRASAPAPAPDDMEPQNISFIGSAEEDALHQGINRLNISSGTRTYRIPSPTRPSLTRNSFQQPVTESSPSEESADDVGGKGFYIAFDNEQPKRPKPPLRAKKGSPRKDRTPSQFHSPERGSPEERPWQDRVPEPFPVHRSIPPSQSAFISHEVPSQHRETPPRERPTHREGSAEPAAIVIGELSNIDPNSAEEMEKKKERIMLLSLQRRARAEEARARAEQAAAAKRARDEAVAEERLAKKEEQARRRDAILQQYKLKKAVEEAEREGKVLDKETLASLKSAGGLSAGVGAAPAVGTGVGARLRGHKPGAARARPKTIHVDSGAVEAAEGFLARKQGSSTNLTAYPSASGASTMRRDYYRGSQDSLADRAGLYRESPVEETRGMSPGAGAGAGAAGGALGRRGSYKTSRERVSEDEPQAPVRGRSKYPTYQNNFKAGRKSSSLINLCDSGLGRATPPRRAASPGVRVLTSPAGSGPGSLPGGIGKRTARPHLDDNASDVSSTHSSIMDYSGPRLYKQPATKSNRGIMLNAVEYCVFPGVVNREAKRRVLEEIARSESKHFLVLFRDAGCQFRALYSYCPDTDNVSKLYGTGPRQVNDRMYDKFFKYNSGSKCFSQIHTKHLTVTIDAFTIHNSLWQGKKVQHPSKKDMALVI